MEKLKSSIINTFKGKNFVIFAGKLKHIVLSIPLQFSVQALSPHSKNTACFASLSQHSFFSRQKPHPHQVTHIQGLNGTSFSIVNDEWSKQAMLSPDHMIKNHFPTSVFRGPRLQMPIGDPQPIPVPRLSIGSLADAWRDELRELAAKERAASFTEKKETVLELLCQILQTDSLTAIQQWLLTADQKEKDLATGLLHVATANLHFEPLELPKSMEERFPPQWESGTDQSGTDFACGQHARNHLIRLLVTEQEQESIPEKEMPVHISIAEVLQLHSSLDEKQNQQNQPK